jgi:hypothetical protein
VTEIDRTQPVEKVRVDRNIDMLFAEQARLEEICYIFIVMISTITSLIVPSESASDVRITYIATFIALIVTTVGALSLHINNFVKYQTSNSQMQKIFSVPLLVIFLVNFMIFIINSFTVEKFSTDILTF